MTYGRALTKSIEVHPLVPAHAETAARLHIQGQPGTFLTALGPDVLRVLYRVLPQSRDGFGFVAVVDERPVAFVAVTASTGRLFLEMGTRRLPQLLPPLLRRYLRRPGLLARSVQTLFYPLIGSGTARSGSADMHATPSAELLSIMTEHDYRGRGVGSILIEHAVSECTVRGLGLLDVTVDEANQGARRFYQRHGFRPHGTIHLSGRRMCVYRSRLVDLKQVDLPGADAAGLSPSTGESNARD